MNKAQMVLKIKKRTEECVKNKEHSEGDGTFFDYYYWQGYMDALDYIDDLLIVLEN